jgi:hypothetical protein
VYTDNESKDEHTPVNVLPVNTVSKVQLGGVLDGVGVIVTVGVIEGVTEGVVVIEGVGVTVTPVIIVEVDGVTEGVVVIEGVGVTEPIKV